MALSLVTVTKDVTRRKKHIVIKITPSANYTLGGDTVDLTKLTNPKLLSNGLVSAIPTNARVLNCPAGYTGEFIIGTTLANSKLKVATTAGAELPAAAYPAALLANPFQVELSGPLGAF